MTSAVCRFAASRVLSKALVFHKVCVGLLLKSFRTINTSMIEQTLVKEFHAAHSEPYYYDSAYLVVKRASPIGVDSSGRCIANNIVVDCGTSAKRGKDGLLKWKCSVNQSVTLKYTLSLPSNSHSQNLSPKCEQP